MGIGTSSPESKLELPTQLARAMPVREGFPQGDSMWPGGNVHIPIAVTEEGGGGPAQRGVLGLRLLARVVTLAAGRRISRTSFSEINRPGGPMRQERSRGYLASWAETEIKRMDEPEVYSGTE